jgi:hypothetical protein
MSARLVPTILQTLQEANPTLVGPNTVSTTGQFLVSQDINSEGGPTNRVYQFAAFEGIPLGSNTCQLAVTFPANYQITSTGNPQINVQTVYTGNPSNISYPNNLSWSSLYPQTSPPVGQGSFGTITFTPGTTQVINTEACPTGVGNLAFLFSIASWKSEAASVEFTQYVNEIDGAGLAGIYLTYD